MNELLLDGGSFMLYQREHGPGLQITAALVSGGALFTEGLHKNLKTNCNVVESTFGADFGHQIPVGHHLHIGPMAA